MREQRRWVSCKLVKGRQIVCTRHSVLDTKVSILDNYYNNKIEIAELFETVQ